MRIYPRTLGASIAGTIRSDITALTDGSASSLDAIPTLNRPKPYTVLINFRNAGVYETRGYVLIPIGVLVPDGNRIIKPTDSATDVWVQTF